MNKELKEFLYMLVGHILTPDDYRKILDYFNQLKQERDHYKNKTLDNLYMKNINGEKVFCLENDKETFRDMIFELQERINKAIEYIDNDFNRFNCFGHLNVAMEMTYKKEELLDILKGSDSNGIHN